MLLKNYYEQQGLNKILEKKKELSKTKIWQTKKTRSARKTYKVMGRGWLRIHRVHRFHHHEFASFSKSSSVIRGLGGRTTIGVAS